MRFVAAILLAPAVLVAQQPAEPPSYLSAPAYALDHELRGPFTAYVPQPGDIMMATDPNKFWWATHAMALAFEPHNSGIIVARRDGSLAVFEAGPNDTLYVRRLDLLPHLTDYANKGRIWIRKRKTPLTPEQLACLTDFAERQDGKRFALIRLGQQLTPLRMRGPVRTYFVGKPRGDREGYYCAELVVESIVAAGLVDPRTARPSATYPRDLFFDHSLNPYLRHHFDLSCGWDPPARWLPCPPPSVP
jgi:hypothetical protein